MPVITNGAKKAIAKTVAREEDLQLVSTATSEIGITIQKAGGMAGLHLTRKR